MDPLGKLLTVQCCLVGDRHAAQQVSGASLVVQNLCGLELHTPSRLPSASENLCSPFCFCKLRGRLVRNSSAFVAMTSFFRLAAFLSLIHFYHK